MAMSELLGKIIVIKRNGADGAHFPLRSKECLFGRNNECDIRIQLPNVSKEHARITVDFDKKVWLTNLSTCADTLLNGTKIPDSTEVSHLDVFTISDRSFRFEFPNPKKVTPKKSPKEKRRSSKGTPHKDFQSTPKGSPRTPPVAETLKENIHLLRRYSVPLKEVDESFAASPLHSKSPLAKVYENTDMEALSTPSGKRKSTGSYLPSAKKSKRVSFGPFLSPEQFDKELPPATPVRRGATPRRSLSEAKPILSEKKKRRSVAASPKTQAIFEEQESESEEVSETQESTSSHDDEPAVKMENTSDVQAPAIESPKSAPNVTPRRSSRRLSSVMTSAEEPMTVANTEQEVFEDKKTKLATPIRKAIEGGVELKKTKKKIATPLRREIQSKPGLRETKKKLATPIRKEIQEGIELKATKKKLATPLRNEIKGGVELKATKKKLATPLRKEIQSKPSLKETKKKLATPLRKEILSKPTLRETKKKLATPVRQEIQSKPKLRQTKKVMDKELQESIKQGVKLRATKKIMAYDLQIDIIKGKKLRETKKKMATPLRDEIKKGKTLKKTMKSMPTPMKEEIQKGIKLKSTKKTLPTPLREEIAQGLSLRQTKKKMATPMRKEIEGGKVLRETKKKMATPMKKEIEEGITLKTRIKKMSTPMKKEIETKPKLNSTKRRKSSSSDEENPVKKQKKTPKESEPAIKKALKTPLRKDIEAGFKLRQTKKRLATPLRNDLQRRRSLRAVRRKSTKLGNVAEQPARKPTYAEILKRPKKIAVRRLSKKLVPNTKFGPTAAPGEATRVASKQKTPAKEQIKDKKTPKTSKVATPDGREEPKMVATPVTRSTRKSGNWQDTIAKSLHSKEEQEMVEENLEGLQELFATPEEAVRKIKTIRKKSGNWLDAIAKTLHGVKTSKSSPGHLQGLQDLFSTPQSVTPSLRSKDTQMSVQVEPVQKSKTPSLRQAASIRNASRKSVATPKIIEVIEPTKTPSLRSAVKTEENFSLDLLFSPVQQTCTPSLRSKQSQLSVQQEPVQASKTPSLRQPVKSRRSITSPKVIQAIEPSKTPSLRPSAVQVVEAIEVTKTPSLRSGVVQVVEAVQPSNTPSLRSAAPTVKSKKTPKERKSLGLTGVKRLMKTPKQKNNTDDPEENFDASMFDAPQSTLAVNKSVQHKKNPSERKSLGLTGVQRLLKTPKQKNNTEDPEENFDASMFDAPQSTLAVNKSVQHKNPSERKSLGLTGVQRLLKTPKQKNDTEDPEENFNAAMFDAPQSTLAVNKSVQHKKNPGERKRLGLTGVQRLLKTPKQKNNTEDPEENFDAGMFDAPQSTLAVNKSVQHKKNPGERKSLGLTSVQRLLKTPKQKNDTEDPEENFNAAIFTLPQSTHKSQRTRNAVADVSGDFIEELAMPKEKSKKSSRIRSAIAHVEDSLEDELFGSSGKAKKSPKKRTPYSARASRKSKQENEDKVTLETEPEIVAEVVVVDDVKPQRRTRGKRAASEDSSVKEPAKKRTRTTATKEKQSKAKAEPAAEITEAACRPTRGSARGKTTGEAKKTSSKTGVVETPKPLSFKRTALEAIPELPTPMTSPLPSTRTRKESAMSPTLEAIQEKETQAKPTEEKVAASKGTRGKSEAKAKKPVPAPEVVAVVPSTRSGRRTRTAKEPEVAQEEENNVEAKPARVTRGRKVVQEKPQEEEVKITRSTRSRKAPEAKQLSSEFEEVGEPKPKRSTRSKKEEKVVTEKPVRATRTRKVQEPVEDVKDETTDEKEEIVKPKPTRTTRGKKTFAEELPSVVEEPKPTRSTRAKRVKPDDEPAIEQKPVTRNTRGKKTKVEKVEEEKPTETVQPRATRSKRAAGKTVLQREEQEVSETKTRATRSKRAAEETPAPKKEPNSSTRGSKREATEDVAPSPKKLRKTTRSKK